MENLSIEQLTKLYTYDELNTIDGDLDEINKQLSIQIKDMEKPDSLVQRVFVDFFGVIALYLLFFFSCDITQAIINDRGLFGFEWIFFGPYYFFTGAPLFTRIWKSKKFLEDLSDFKNIGFEYPTDSTCSREGQIYTNSCTSHEEHPHRHPLRQKLGPKLDWLLRHTVGKSFGGLLGNATCEDQGSTIAADCANNRIDEIFDCYNFFCDQYNGIKHRATDKDWPNTVASGAAVFNGWNDYDKTAYKVYYDCYRAIYDIGSTVFGGKGAAENLNPNIDDLNYYAFNANRLFQTQGISIPSPGARFAMPHWYQQEVFLDGASFDTEEFMRYFQLHYKEHMLDYWDDTSLVY